MNILCHKKLSICALPPERRAENFGVNCVLCLTFEYNYNGNIINSDCSQTNQIRETKSNSENKALRIVPLNHVP